MKSSPFTLRVLPAQHFDSATLAAAARVHCAVPLRRAGALTELVIAGVAQCLVGEAEAPTMVLWGSPTGIRAATLRVVSELTLAHEAPLPFDFLATQPILAAIPLQQSFPCIINAIYQPWGSDVELHRARMRTLAGAWLQAGRCARVLCGEVAPGAAEGGNGAHCGQWQVLET